MSRKNEYSWSSTKETEKEFPASEVPVVDVTSSKKVDRFWGVLEVEGEFAPARYPDDALLSDLVKSIVDTGSPQFSSEMFINANFSWSDPKKKNRTLGGSKLEFPRGAYVGQFTDVDFQFYSLNSIINFIKTLDHSEEDCDLPFCVRAKVQEQFPGAAIGVAGGYYAGKPGYTCNIIWTTEKQRVYYDPFNDETVKFSPTVIVI
jgi:hypothetical protein